MDNPEETLTGSVTTDTLEAKAKIQSDLHGNAENAAVKKLMAQTKMLKLLHRKK